MSDIWIEVIDGCNPDVIELLHGHDKSKNMRQPSRYYWNRLKGDVLRTSPPGVRVAWTMQRSSSGRVFYWNKRTQESLWSLPALRAEDAGGARRAAPHVPRQEVEEQKDCSESLHAIVEHAKTLEGVRTCSGEEFGVDVSTTLDLLLLHSVSPLEVHRLFPSDFLLAYLEQTSVMSAGFIAVVGEAKAGGVGDVVNELEKLWWELAQVTSCLATLVVLTRLEGARAIDAEARLRRAHWGVALQVPGPLVFVADRGSASPLLRRRIVTEGYQRNELEENLVAAVAQLLSDGVAREVQELASIFKLRFIEVVGSQPAFRCNAERWNDGSFKKWLITQGFELSDMFDRSSDRNKCLVSLPKYFFEMETNDVHVGRRRNRRRGPRRPGGRVAEEG